MPLVLLCHCDDNTEYIHYWTKNDDFIAEIDEGTVTHWQPLPALPDNKTRLRGDYE